MASRILYMLDNFPGPAAGGTEAQFWMLYQALDRPTWQPRVVTLRPSAYLQAELPASEYATLAITSMKSPVAWLRAWRLARAARREGFGLAHLYLNDVSVLMPPFFRLAGLRVIVSRRDLGFWYTGGLLHVLRLIRHCVDRVVANCAAVKVAVCAAERYRPGRVEVIMNGYRPPTGALPAPRFRAAAGVPEEAVVLGMVANLRPLKRIEDAIAALGALPAGTPPVWLLVAGEDRPYAGRPGSAILMEQAAALGVSARVRFLGPLAEPWALLQEVDIFLSCSDTEGLSNSIIEAMAAGLPVVGSAVGGTPELIDDSVTGFLYPARDVDALAARLVMLVNDGKLRARLGAAARRFAEAHLSVRQLVANHERAYRQLLSHSTVGGHAS